ncbi:MAG TPA: hypothetical protein VND98_03890 [Solirubrobacterales bacterium]|nr:hypothetical protein [Solirubrobacterales bacterium]
MARVLAVVSDLMLASRVSEGLAATGHEVSVQPTLPQPVAADVIVCDLDAVDAEAIAATGIPSLGFYSHLEVETRARAQRAGVSLVVPRSRMARELPALLETLL